MAHIPPAAFKKSGMIGKAIDFQELPPLLVIEILSAPASLTYTTLSFTTLISLAHED